MKGISHHFLKAKTRLYHWEYWNTNIVYFPILPYLLYLMVRSRNIFFFKQANPGIENGGFTMESKWKIQVDCNQIHFPKSQLVKKEEKENLTVNDIEIDFPFIVKPDIGGKGRAVQQINSIDKLNWYHRHCPIDYLIQEKITFPNEIGVFYVRMPTEKFGFISGIVSKKFIEIKGNGVNTIEELLLANKRFVLQIDKLKKLKSEDYFQRILEVDELELITEIGNHAQGSQFFDFTYKINDELTNKINQIANQLPGFYFGRLDIKFNSWEEFERGENFAIIEINGTGSEPTHIYDTKHSIFFAWKEITRHWKLMYCISKQNSASKNSKLTIKEGVNLFKSHFLTMKRLDKFSKISKY